MSEAETWLVAGAIIALVVLSFLLTAVEAAFDAVSRAKLHAHIEAGDPRAARVERLLVRKDRLLGSLLICNNLARVVAVGLAVGWALTVHEWDIALYTVVALTLIFVIFTDILPRSWAVARPERVALAFSRFARILVICVGPVAIAANRLVRWFLALFGISLAYETPMLSARDELREAMDVLHRDGAVVKQDRDRMGGLLDLAELEIYDVMVHRTNIRSISADGSTEEIVREVLQSPHTRMPVWKGSSENIIGVLHTKDLLRALNEAGNDYAQINIAKLASKPWFVPETTTLQDQLNAFLRRKAHFAIVVDEYGEVKGLVTLEDIIEEIVGDIADEHDVDVQGVRQEADGSVVVDGSVPIRDLNRALDWSLPDEEATTIAGLVIHETQIIPRERQAFTFHGKRFIVMRRDKNRIMRIRIKPAETI